jgi:aspartyl-tRNA(Asn)/glutamyl-tRNA(Gln) amidotransferase subunit A
MSKELIKKAVEEAKQINDEYHFFNYICKEEEVSSKDSGKLHSYAISVKDAINVKDIETTAGSKVLNGYKPLFDATVIERVKNEGGMIIGKTAQDEFGFGGFSVNVGVDKKIPLNPLDKTRSCGGSSGGCAGITGKTALKHISLAESTGGSIVCPASFCGVVGLCPTYGRVSRYGLIDYGNSLDKIGPIAKNVHDIALALEVISGKDERDSTCADVKVDKYTDFVGKPIKGMKIGIIKEAFGEGVEKEIAEIVRNKVEELKTKGVIVEEVSLPITSKYSLAVYYLIATSEASTNLAKFCGMRYGTMEDPVKKSFNDYFTDIRSSCFSEEAKRRVIIGTFARMAGFRDAYYIKAAKIRTLIINEYKALFKKYDALVCPTMSVIAPKLDEIKKMTPLQSYMIDILTVGPNLAGIPHMTLSCGKIEGMPVGIMFLGDHFAESKIIQLASAIEEE